MAAVLTAPVGSLGTANKLTCAESYRLSVRDLLYHVPDQSQLAEVARLIHGMCFISSTRLHKATGYFRQVSVLHPPIYDRKKLLHHVYSMLGRNATTITPNVHVPKRLHLSACSYFISPTGLQGYHVFLSMDIARPVDNRLQTNSDTLTLLLVIRGPCSLACGSCLAITVPSWVVVSKRALAGNCGFTGFC